MEDSGAIQELARHWEPLLTILILGFVQVCKTAMPSIPARVIPLVNLMLGIGLMVVLTSFTVPAVIAGSMIGFAASGLWSSGKTVGKPKIGG